MRKYERITGKIVVRLEKMKDITDRIVVVCWNIEKKRDMMVVGENFT